MVFAFALPCSNGVVEESSWNRGWWLITIIQQSIFPKSTVQTWSYIILDLGQMDRATSARFIHSANYCRVGGLSLTRQIFWRPDQTRIQTRWGCSEARQISGWSQQTHKAWNQCRINAGPPSTTLTEHWFYIGSCLLGSCWCRGSSPVAPYSVVEICKLRKLPAWSVSSYCCLALECKDKQQKLFI